MTILVVDQSNKTDFWSFSHNTCIFIVSRLVNPLYFDHSFMNGYIDTHIKRLRYQRTTVRFTENRYMTYKNNEIGGNLS